MAVWRFIVCRENYLVMAWIITETKTPPKAIVFKGKY